MKLKQIILITLILTMLVLSACVTGQAKGGVKGGPGNGGGDDGGKIVPACSDRIDNDGDGYCDWAGQKKCRDGSIPGDADCTDRNDNNEASECVPEAEICDQMDNDCDGIIDESLSIECNSNAACGHLNRDDVYCANGDRYFTNVTAVCTLAGTCNSACEISVNATFLLEECENGCENGECIVENTCFNGQWDEGEDQGQVDCGGNCVPCTYSNWCYDSDGVNQSVKGYVSFNNGTSINTTVYDTCVGNYTLKEHYCDGVNPAAYNLDCNPGGAQGPSYCWNGACQ